MKPKTIAIIPEYGLNMGMNHSHKQLLWLKYISINNNINIQHCKNGGEHKIGKYHLDVYDANTNTGYDFMGAYFMAVRNVSNLRLLIQSSKKLCDQYQ
jgi:hypothetical protein